MGILGRGTRGALCGATMLALGLTASTVHAAPRGAPNDPQMRSAARYMADSADLHYRRGDYERALKLFEMAESLYHAPTLVLAIADTYQKLGKLVAAQRHYRKVADEKLGARPTRAFRQAQATAKTQLAKLDKAVPTVMIEVPGDASGTQLRVDGKAVPEETIGKPLPLDPGSHYIVATKGNRSRSFELKLEEGDREKVVASIDSEAGPKAAEGPALGWLPPTLVGVGVVGITVGAITGSMALGDASDVKATCSPGLVDCDPALQGTADGARSLAAGSTAAFIIGGAMFAAGTAWLVVDTVMDGDVTVQAGLQGVQVQGRF